MINGHWLTKVLLCLLLSAPFIGLSYVIAKRRSINPVKHGWIETVKEWPYSTFHSLVEKGVYPIDWAASSIEGVDAGERE